MRLKGSALYGVWKDMHKRCSNPKSLNYPHYGGRGIKVCKHWFELDNFIIDMGHRPPGMSLDRIDNNGDYCPENCRWATDKEQMNNTRNNLHIEAFGRVQTLAQWCVETGLKRPTVNRRLKDGWNVEAALFIKPVPTRDYGNGAAKRGRSAGR
jgi:hypothetical protein